MSKKLISTREAAALLQTSQRWVNYLIAKKKLTPTRVSSAAFGPWLLQRAQVNALAKERTARLKAKNKKKVVINGRASADAKKGRARRPDRKKGK